MDDPYITMKEYIRIEEEKARRHGKVYNWKTATYGKIWYDEDVHDLGSIETEFPAIVFNDTLTSKVALSCEPMIKLFLSKLIVAFMRRPRRSPEDLPGCRKDGTLGNAYMVSHKAFLVELLPSAEEVHQRSGRNSQHQAKKMGNPQKEFVRRWWPLIANGRIHSRRGNSKKLDKGKTSRREAFGTNKGKTRQRRKKQRNLLKRQATGNPDGTTMAEGEEDGTEGLMIIEAEMGDTLSTASTPLVGFSGEIIWPLGQISLLVKIGDEEHSTSAWMNFMVVRSPSPHNGIIGRLGVRRIQAVPSTTHGMLKFPVTGGTVTLRSHRRKDSSSNPPRNPEQTIAIGSTLTEEGQKELCGLLRRNLDIFSWKPADMTGVSRHIAKHRLNIREGCLPVRQKKMG
ncbi:hypothetical protein Tco_0451234 [Tanacetum coccineum]